MLAGYVPDVHKIAVLRANALGDFIVSLPAFYALRAAYPTAEIVLLALAWHAAFLRERPSPIDRVVIVPPYRGVSVSDEEESSEEALRPFFQRMREEKFDLACQLHGGGHHSNAFLQRLGARLTVGSRTPEAADLDRWIPYRYFQQESIRYLEIVSLVGAAPVLLDPYLAVTAQDRAEVENVLSSDEQLLAVLHPGAGDPRRRWPGENFARVGDALASYGARIVIVGTERDRDAIEQVEQAMCMPCENLCGRLSLGGLAALFARSSAVVANDSGPLHLAQAVGARSVGLYWCFNLPTFAPLSRLKHCPLISWQLTCPLCGHDYTRGSCSHNVSLLGPIVVEEVVAAAQEMMEYNVLSSPLRVQAHDHQRSRPH